MASQRLKLLFNTRGTWRLLLLHLLFPDRQSWGKILHFSFFDKLPKKVDNVVHIFHKEYKQKKTSNHPEDRPNDGTNVALLGWKLLINHNLDNILKALPSMFVMRTV